MLLNLGLAENENECPARGVPGVEFTNGKRPGVRLRASPHASSAPLQCLRGRAANHHPE